MSGTTPKGIGWWPACSTRPTRADEFTSRICPGLGCWAGGTTPPPLEMIPSRKRQATATSVIPNAPRPKCVGGPHSEASHGRAREVREVDRRDQVLGQHAPQRGAQQYSLSAHSRLQLCVQPRQRVRGRQDVEQLFGHGQVYTAGW